MEVLKDAKFNLIETDNLIVKNMNSYNISINTVLDETSSGVLYLLNSENNSITITLPFRKSGLNYEFIFNNTSSNFITFKTSNDPLDNSKFIGTDWLYLKRTDISINYSSLTGSELIFNNCQKGEYIKFYSDGNNYYIIEKNDTNNNINNIITLYPDNSNSDFIVNINLNNNIYTYDIRNINTNETLKSIYMNTTYNFKFDTTTNEYNSLTNITNILTYNLYIYIEYYELYYYTLDNENCYYKYPVFNYKLYDYNNNLVNILDLFNTTYILNLNNNSIKYPGYLYTLDINLDKESSTSTILIDTSILNIDYNSIDDNLVIYNEFNSVIYDHNNDRHFLIANRDINYRINYLNTTFTIAILNSTEIIKDTYTTSVNFKFTSSLTQQSNFIINIVSEINTTNQNNNLYYLYLKTNISGVDKIFKIPLLFIDTFILQPINSDSNISIKNKQINQLPIVLNNISYNYEFDIIGNLLTSNDNLELLFLNTIQNNNLVLEEHIFKLMRNKLIINTQNANLNDYLLKFMSTSNNIVYYNTTITDLDNYKTISLNIDYVNMDNINISYYSNFNNVNGGNFKLNQFIIDDNYSGKVINVDLKNNIVLNLSNNINGNFYEIVVDNDNTIDENTYTLVKKKNENLVDEYYFTKNNSTDKFKNIDMYTNNIYTINLDSTISILDIARSTDKSSDLIQFSNIKDGLINFKKQDNYTFIQKQVNSSNNLVLIFDLINYLTPTTLYYYNRNIRNIGGIINILSLEQRLNNITLYSQNPFTTTYKYFINNISYEKKEINGINNYILTLKKMKKGNTIKLYYNNNTNIIRDIKFNDNDESIINYPENIISTNNFNLKFIENPSTNVYNITLQDDSSNLINNTDSLFKFVKNQIYTIEQSDITNYNLANNTNNIYYLKTLYNNSSIEYEYYIDSKFTNKINNLNLYRGLQYKFRQYHRSNYNPDINIDLYRVFKVTLQKNINNVNVFYLNNMEQYIPNLLVNTPYYFDISDVIDFKFQISLFNDGLENGVLNIYNTNEIEYITNSLNKAYLIKVRLLETNENSILYYYSNNIRSIGSYINIIKSPISYILNIQETKYNITNSTLEYYYKKNLPKYNITFKNNSTLENKKNILFFKNPNINYLTFKLNFDNTIVNKLYTTEISDIIASNNITIYVNEVYNDNFPALSYFEFYTEESLNSISQIKLPLTLLKNKKYTFKQINYKISKYKFFIFINEYPTNYIKSIINFSSSSEIDTNLFSFSNNEGFTIDTNNFIVSSIYYSGIHYTDQILYTGEQVSSLTTYSKLLLNYKILLVIDKNIYLSDDYSVTDKTIALTENLAQSYYVLTQNNIKTNDLFKNDMSILYLKNNSSITLETHILEILDTNLYISEKKTDSIYISNISYSSSNKHNSIYNRDIYLIKNVLYNFTVNNSKYEIQYTDTLISLTDLTKNNINFNNNTIYYDYILLDKNSTNTSQNNNSNQLTLDSNTNLIFESTGTTTNWYTIHNENITTGTTSVNNTFDKSIYTYFITIKNSITNFSIKYNTNSNSSFIFEYLDFNNSISNNTNTLTITPTTDKIQYVNLVLQENTSVNNIKNTIIYNFKILKETTYKFINYGKIIINDYEDIINNNSNVYLSKPVKYTLSDTDNTLPNSNLLNTYTLELVDTEYYTGETIKQIYNKKFIFNNDLYNNVINNDTILNNNIITSNLYISDFRTIIIDTSNESLLNDKITLYTDEAATQEYTNNIIYKETCGTPNSKIILNINPHINSVLFYYSNCLFSSKFKYNMKIKTLSNKIIQKLSTITNTQTETIYNIYDLDIIPFLENSNDIYYNIESNTININLDRGYFILYNSTTVYKGTIICDKSYIDGTNIYYNNKMYLKFNEDFKLISGSINITSDFTIKIFKYTGGTIYTPNYIYLNKINSNTGISSNISLTNNKLYSNTTDLYLYNNKEIKTNNTLKYNDNSEKFYLIQGCCENFKYNTTLINTLTNRYINLNNTIIQCDDSNILNTSNTSITNNKIQTRHTTPIITSTIKPYSAHEQSNNINVFNILVYLYRTDLTTLQYYSIKFNINGFSDTLLILKPCHSYTFIVNEDLLLRDINKYYKLDSVKLSIVNINNTTINNINIINTVNNIITINIPENNLYNKLYLKCECKIINNNDNTEHLSQGYYARNNTGNMTTFSNKFIEYLPIILDNKSVINNNITFKNNNYYINNYINKLNIYSYFINIFTFNTEKFNINITNNIKNFDDTNTNKIYIYYDKHAYNNYNLTTDKSTININTYFTELLNTQISTDSKYIIYLTNNYNGNDSSNDYIDNIEQKYINKYVGEPGYTGEYIYNLNNILDFNINTNNILQNKLYLNNITYFDTNITKYNYFKDLYNTYYLNLTEPVKLKIEYEDYYGIYRDLDNYTYSDNFYPGKSNSKISIQIPKDIDNDNIFNENIRLIGVGYYSNTELISISKLTISSDVYILPQYNCTIFLDINNDVTIRLPTPNYSLVYKFIINNVINDVYTLTFITNNNIYGYIDTSLNKNVALKNNKQLIFKNIVKGNTFTLVSNQSNYYLENMIVNRHNNDNTTINYNKTIIYLPNKTSETININVNEEKFTLTNQNNILYKNKIYNINTQELLNNTDFQLLNLNILQPYSNIIDISNNITLNDYNNIYSIFKLNSLGITTIQNFNSYITNNTVFNISVNYNNNKNNILFNNSENTITLYTNYIYNFIKPVGFYILENFDFNINADPSITNNDNITILTNFYEIKLRINNIIYNSINFNTHKLIYVYFKPLILNNDNNTLIINESTSTGTNVVNITLDTEFFGTYNYTINTNILLNDLVSILNIKLIVYNYEINIVEDKYKLEKIDENIIFNIVNSNLSILLGFNNEPSFNNIIYGTIPYIYDTFNIKDYYLYYGEHIKTDYFTLLNNNSNSIISVDLEIDKHINLPIINEGLSYTFIINNSIINKNLFIHSYSLIHNIDTNTSGNILLITPHLDKKLNIYITISCNDNKYFITDIKGFEYNINLYNIKLYNSRNNFSNLYYTINGISNIDKYFSVYNIHVIGLSNNDKLLSENKFLHVVKTLARILDYNQNETMYDYNIYNSIVYQNSYILLYNNTIPSDYFINNKHTNNVFISYNDININYDYKKTISSTNLYDYTLETILELLIKSYIYTYPDIFTITNDTSLNNINVYDYINNKPIIGTYTNNISNEIYIEDKRLTKSLTKIITNKYFTVTNITSSSGENLNIRINSLVLNYNANFTILTLDFNIVIANIGIGYKNNDKVKIILDPDLNLILTLKTLKDTTDSYEFIYNTYYAHNEINNTTLNKLTINEKVFIDNDSDTEGVDDSININSGNIITDNSINYKLTLNNVLYNNNLNNSNDIINYVKYLLLSLLGYFKYRNILGNNMSNIHFNIITPTLVKQYNNKFVGLYFTTSLRNINNLDDIHNYNLDLLNYIKSDISELENLELYVSGIPKIINFNNLIKIYKDITFNNLLNFVFTKQDQYNIINTTAIKTNSEGIITSLPIINLSSNNTLVDVSSVGINSNVNININVISELNTTTNYNIILNKDVGISNDASIKEINTYKITEFLSKTTTENIVYFYLDEINPINNKLQIILNNIYSNIGISSNNNSININNVSISNTNIDNNYSFDYIFKPTYYKTKLDFTVETENKTTIAYNYILQKYPNNIALLNNVIITNVSNVNTFDTYNFHYNGLLKKSVYDIFNKYNVLTTDDLNNINIMIYKTDKYSSVNTIIEYLDYDNKYIVFKTTPNLFINDILTLDTTKIDDILTLDTTKMLNNEHKFFNKFKIDSITRLTDTDGNVVSTNYELSMYGTIGERIETGVRSEAQLDDNTILYAESTVNKIINLHTDISASTNYSTVINENTEILIKSTPIKETQTENKILDISTIKNIKITISVTSEDTLVKNNYIYIINIK